MNDHLLELMRKMFGEHMKLLGSLRGNPVMSVTNWDDVVVESKLDVDEDAKVLRYDDDDDYGSDFTQMIDAIAWTEDLEIHSCFTTLGEESEPTILMTVPHGQKVVLMFHSSVIFVSVMLSMIYVPTRSILFLTFFEFGPIHCRILSQVIGNISLVKNISCRFTPPNIWIHK